MTGKDGKKSIFMQILDDHGKVYIILTAFWIFICAVSYLLLCISPVCDYDESYTVSMISHSFSDIVKITSNDVHSPLYYFLVRIFSFLPGVNFVHAPKLFSYVCTMAFLIVGSVFMYRKYSGRAAFYFVFIASVNPMMISQVCNGRMYAAGLLSFTIALFEAHLLTEEIRTSRIAVLIISSIVTVWMHTVFMTMTVFLFVIFIVCSLIKKEYKNFRIFLISGIVTGTSFLPWLFVVMRQYANKNSSGSLMHPLSDFAYYREYFRFWKDDLFSGTFYSEGWMIRFWIAIFLLMIAGIFVYIGKNKKDLLPLFGPVVMFLTFLITGIMLLMYSGQFFARYAFPAFSGIWLTIAVLLSADLFKKKQLNIAFGVFKVLLLLTAFVFGFKTYNAQKAGLSVSGIDEYLSCMDEVEEGDAVMFSDTWSSIMQIYDTDEEYWIYGYNPDGMPFEYKGVYTNTSQMEDYSRIWMVGNDSIEMNSPGDGFSVKKTVEFDHHSYHFIVKLYEKS